MKNFYILIFFLSLLFYKVSYSQVELSFVIEEPDISFSFDEDNANNIIDTSVSAYGFSDAYITIYIQGGWGGLGNYEAVFNGNVIQVNNDSTGYFISMSNLSAGNYTLEVTDKENCLITRNFQITEPPVLNLSVEITTPISCNTANVTQDTCNTCNQDGVLTATASGGVPPYDFIWTDNNGVTLQTTYDVALDPTTSVATDTLSNLAAGTYSVNVIDANGITIGNYNINTGDLNYATPLAKLLKEPDAITIQEQIDNVKCYDGNDGKIYVSIGSSNATYTSYYLVWKNEDGGVEDEELLTVPSSNYIQAEIGDLEAGDYELTVTTDKGCISTTTYTVSQPQAPISISYTYTEPLSFGASNGEVVAVVTGGTPNYTYVWTNEAGDNLNANTSTQTNQDGNFEITLSNIPAGQYHLEITDSNNCSVGNTDDSIFTLNEPRPLVIDHFEVVSPISCKGDSDGVLQVFGDGGVILEANENNGLAYFYAWYKKDANNVYQLLANQTTDIATGLDIGDYQVIITDHNNILSSNIEAYSFFTLTEPEELSLSFTKQNVYCIGGDDGSATVNITGGTQDEEGNYQITWFDGSTNALIENLEAGTYEVTVVDSHDCQKTASVTINEPLNPININYTAFSTPSIGGASDGWIEAQITGGTAFADGSYTYYWLDENGTDITSQVTTSIVNGIYQIRLNNITAGMYFLTIEDANYTLATAQDGCTFIANDYTLYDPIEITIEVLTPISCNHENTFDNPFGDGELIATVTGGLPFDTGLPYIYHWKKKNDDGDYEILTNQTTETATELIFGDYALNVEDALGNVMGTYQSSTLIEAIDALFTFEEPELLEVTLSKTDITCEAGNDGIATVSVTGGTSPYNIFWSNGLETPTIENLIAGNYLVYITDDRGCEVTGQVSLSQPSTLDVAITEQNNPTCYQGNDGNIIVEIIGGQEPYVTYGWKKKIGNDIWEDVASQTMNIDNLEAGIYRFSVKDTNNCNAFIDVELEDPEQIPINIEETKTLCNEQILYLDVQIDDDATYLWESDNGFTSTEPQVEIFEAGTYTITITNSFECVNSKSINIITENIDIDAQFLLTSQAFADEDVILINTSNPIGEITQWIIPEEVNIIEQTNETITLHFTEEGIYEIGLETQQGDCNAIYAKNIQVNEARDLPDIGDAEDPFISEFVAYPNPNSGNFTASIVLKQEAEISLRLFSLISNTPLDDRQFNSQDNYQIDYTSLNLSSGIYYLLLETPNGSEIRKIIIE